jgi:hypothetical protein
MAELNQTGCLRSRALSTLIGWVARREGEAPAEPCPFCLQAPRLAGRLALPAWVPHRSLLAKGWE